MLKQLFFYIILSAINYSLMEDNLNAYEYTGLGIVISSCKKMGFINNVWYVEFLVEDSFVSLVKQATLVHWPVRDRLLKAWLKFMNT